MSAAGTAPAGTALVTLADVEAAAARIADVVLRTPLVEVPHPDRPDDVLLAKAESLQPTGAFKLRGASNAILQDLDRAREHGVVAQSSGNHGRAVAWLARRLGLRAVVVMPDAAPATKVAAVRALGAEVELVPPDRRDVRPHEIVASDGMVLVPPYDDDRVIAGQGTVGLELLAQAPDTDAVLVPVSGGGLVAGISTAVKALRPDVAVIGVEPELAADAAESLRTGRRVAWETSLTYRTIADGMRTNVLGERPWEHVRRHVDDIVTVSDDQIRDTMAHLATAARLVAEPAGAAATAAWLHDLVPTATAPVAIVSGGSVDPALLREVLGDRTPA